MLVTGVISYGLLVCSAHVAQLVFFSVFFNDSSLFYAAKYDVAISTACPGLDYILVETADAAQKCVDLLREKNLGVATFMILVKI